MGGVKLAPLALLCLCSILPAPRHPSGCRPAHSLISLSARAHHQDRGGLQNAVTPAHAAAWPGGCLTGPSGQGWSSLRTQPGLLQCRREAEAHAAGPADPGDRGHADRSHAGHHPHRPASGHPNQHLHPGKHAAEGRRRAVPTAVVLPEVLPEVCGCMCRVQSCTPSIVGPAWQRLRSAPPAAGDGVTGREWWRYLSCHRIVQHLSQ